MMIELARHFDQGPVQLGEIGRRQGISVKYLEQLIIPLKKAKYVRSLRGPKGGHMLTRMPRSIRIGEIVRLLENEFSLAPCLEDPEMCERSEECETRDIWQLATEAVMDRLDSITLEAALHGVKSAREPLETALTAADDPGRTDPSAAVPAEPDRAGAEPNPSIVSIAVSRRKGTRKTIVEEARLVPEHGLEGDAHAGTWHRQVSFLASESIARARETGLDVTFGDFAENIATRGVHWLEIPVGTQVRLGDSALVEITQIGKECPHKCAIYYQAGDCIMPREGIFGRVLEGGSIRAGDAVRVMERPAENQGGR